MVLAPEHELVSQITTVEQKDEIEKYLTYVKSRSDRERMAEVKQITGAFTGAYASNPFNQKQIPIWISEYVLAGYGTGAIMAVPCGDQRDFNFAKHFNIPITNIIGEYFNGEEANATKEATLTNSDFLDGMPMKDAIGVVIDKLEELGIGKRKINYKMRDAGFSRQRYWGEPFPIIYKDGIAYPLDENVLPVTLPHVENYKPGPEGEGPLANIKEWYLIPTFSTSGEGESAKNDAKTDSKAEIVRRETNTMPGYAGSSWYFLRYMDPHNENVFADKKATDYWNQVDVYVGGTEHAVGHLLYSRMWTKVLYDLELISFDEPFKKLVNQGMIQGVSEYILRYDTIKVNFIGEGIITGIEFETGTNHFINRIKGEEFQIPLDKDSIIYYSADTEFAKQYFEDKNQKFDLNKKLVDIKFTKNSRLDIITFLSNRRDDGDVIFVCKSGYFKNNDFINFDNSSQNGAADFFTIPVVEKMSKSKLNVINPNEIIEKYGADTFRMYEMFLGPVEQSKPWDTKGIEGVHRFLKKLWRLFFDELKGKLWNDEKPKDAELKVLHRTIKKIEEDTERFSYNTAVSAFMVCVNELHDLKCFKKEILEQVLVLLTPYAPHISAELWHQLQNEGSVLDASFPVFDAKYLVESTKEYPISINGKLRTTINISLGATQDDVQKIVLENEVIKKWVEDKPIKKLIYVKGKMVNVVV
jgi:leucyl-tRNA synthetase